MGNALEVPGKHMWQKNGHIWRQHIKRWKHRWKKKQQHHQHQTKGHILEPGVPNFCGILAPILTETSQSELPILFTKLLSYLATFVDRILFIIFCHQILKKQEYHHPLMFIIIHYDLINIIDVHHPLRVSQNSSQLPRPAFCAVPGNSGGPQRKKLPWSKWRR